MPLFFSNLKYLCDFFSNNKRPIISISLKTLVVTGEFDDGNFVEDYKFDFWIRQRLNNKEKEYNPSDEIDMHLMGNR
jgi:hypothetical protein